MEGDGSGGDGTKPPLLRIHPDSLYGSFRLSWWAAFASMEDFSLLPRPFVFIDGCAANLRGRPSWLRIVRLPMFAFVISGAPFISCGNEKYAQHRPMDAGRAVLTCGLWRRAERFHGGTFKRRDRSPCKARISNGA